jgi:predicted type IV restriction endonuclease
MFFKKQGTVMPAPQIILELVERFGRNIESYKSGAYNETQVRREFIDPFFEALGWDVNNKEGNAEAYKDVIHEDAVKVSGVTKAPDYSFRIGGQRKFFVEAKKPSVNIKDAPAAAFQVRRYAWSGKLPLSIVTDFDELAVYDCRIKPDQNDKADKARIKYYTYRQYAEKWDEIAAIFSKDAILKGSFDKYAESNKTKRGTAEVDSAFLAEIESWREMLAKNIALRNTLSVRELNDSVQRIIDRIIFLRIAEDRGIEDYGALRGICNGNNTYGRLQELFYKADDRYNSGLFHFRQEKDETEPPDKLTTTLAIDDKPLKDILKTLYYPDSPYEFAVLPADILGQVYEQFLGKVIRLTSDHRAVVEDKPEVKKAGGVFYTPTYIVEYIVKNTVGKLLEGKTPKKVDGLRILDPACGSGSFLLGAYQYLLDWHLKWYSENEPGKWAKAKRPALYQGQGSAWHLTTAERKRILLNNIYGVDIDSQAVEVTKLSLLLKVLEDETDETLNRQRKLFHERALPNLGGNIKCGNSLIGPDYYDGKQMNLLDNEEAQRVNVFDWQTEFSEIFKAGGFDAVIGNPPYIQSRSDMITEQDKNYLYQNYQTSEYQLNTYGLFIEKGFKLLREGGGLGYIIPNYWLSTKYDEKLRDFVFKQNAVAELVNVYKVFANATVDTVLLKGFRTLKPSYPKSFTIRSVDRSFITIPERLNAVKAGMWSYTNEHCLLSDTTPIGVSFSDVMQLKGEKTLADYFVFKFGMKPYEAGKGEPSQTREMMDAKIYHSKEKINECWQPLLTARNVKRYRLDWQGDWIKYGENLAAPRDPALFFGPRILIQRIISSTALSGSFADESLVCNTDVITLKPKQDLQREAILFFLGILLSRVCAKYLKSRNVNLDRAAFPKINVNTLESFPVPIPNEKSRLPDMVEQMLALHKQITEAKTGHEQTMLQRQIDATDRQIDKLVYELYKLTPEEIKIVEGQ